MENRKITKFAVNSVLDITKTEIFIANHQFDVDIRAINCLNGELHFKDGNWHLETHDRENYRTTEHKHKNPFDFHPFCTCWFGTNHMPHCRDFSDAIFRKTIILSFNKKFDGTNRDVHLRQKLQKEMSGILNLALERIAGVFKQGDFTYCLSNEAAKKQWRFECDQVEQFVTDI